MKNSVCKIYKCNGTGFFCNIPFNNGYYKALITNYHVIDDKYIKDNNIIKISLNDEKVQKDIKELNKRKIYLNDKYDITIIEIKDSDKINVDYLEIDNKIFEDNSEFYYEKNSIYILHYPYKDKVSVSYGIIQKIDEYNINHICCTQPGSSGSPIMNLLNNKIIGIHTGYLKYDDFNISYFIKNAISDFIQNENKNKLDKNIMDSINNYNNINIIKINYDQIKKELKKYNEKENIKKEELNIKKIIEGISEIYKFDNEITKMYSQKDINFFIQCSIINKEWYKKFLVYSNYNLIKEDLKANKNIDIEDILTKNKHKIDFNGIGILFQRNKIEIEIKHLDNIENLAFISKRFLENINEFRKENIKNENYTNNLIINGNNKEIIIKNGESLLEINDQQFCCFDLQERSLNKQKNIEIFDIPEDLKKIDFLKDIKEGKEKGNLRDICNKKLIKRITV